jgi:dGTPase
VHGLNLTQATLNAILKYPWLFGAHPSKKDKWGAYETERSEFEWARQAHPFQTFAKTVEAELMDWADDITYAVHDLGDFFSAGQIPLDRLVDEDDQERELFFGEVFQRRQDLAQRRDELEEAFLGALGLFPLDRRFVGTRAQLCDLWRFGSILISRYVGAIRLTVPADAHPKLVHIEKHAEDEITMLKQLTWHYVILRNDLATVQYGQREMIRHVFDTFHNAAQSSAEWKLFPLAHQKDLHDFRGDNHQTTRLVTDYVAGMTENEVRRIYATISGRTV